MTTQKARQIIKEKIKEKFQENKEFDLILFVTDIEEKYDEADEILDITTAISRKQGKILLDEIAKETNMKYELGMAGNIRFY